MRLTGLLIGANLRRKKGQTAWLIGFVALAAAVLALGLTLSLRYTGAYDRAAAAANVADLVVLETDNLHSPSHFAYLTDRPGVTAWETEPVLAASLEVAFNGAETQMVPMITQVDRPRTMDRVEPRADARPLGPGQVWLPYLFQIGGGYAIGDRITLPFDRSWSARIEPGPSDAGAAEPGLVELTVAGFTDEAYFSSPTFQWFRFLVDQATYEALARRLPQLEGQLLSLQIDDRQVAPNWGLDYSGAVIKGDPAVMAAQAAGTGLAYQMDWSTARQGRVFMADILAVTLTAFSAIIALIGLIVIRFRVRGLIEESITDLGALKALGHTSAQLARAVVGQFVAVAGVGAVLGVGLAHLAGPALASVLSAQSALTWRPSFDPLVAGLCLATMVSTVGLVAGWTAWRIRRLTPLTALRTGLSGHHHRRDWFPLDRRSGPVTWWLALKATVRAGGQTAMIGLITAAVAFAATAAVAAWDNMAVKQEPFFRAVGGELPDVIVRVEPTSARPALERLRADPAVRTAFRYSNDVPLRLNGDSTTGVVTDDFAAFEGNMLFQGRWPAHPNETAVSARQADQLGLTRGDTVTLTAADRSAEYIVSGLIQTMNDGGLLTALTTAGLDRVWPDQSWSQIGVNLVEADAVESFMAGLDDLVGPGLIDVLDLRRTAEALLGVYGGIMGAVAGVVVVITAVVITLVLLLVLGAAVQRQRRQLGLQRALGYTTGQLIWQVAATYWPVMAVATTVGCLVGQFAFPRLIDLAFRSLGVPSVQMVAPPVGVAVLAGGLALFGLAVALLVATRVRRTTVYELISE
ncbi:MAG: ABC transporter permease [Propionibacteriaceae bacterium]|jgi:putative ABC transport system permease protein|nr:ABC transporter permease [Propionibacteriaceae bacterium]